jgi:hypothetical protein
VSTPAETLQIGGQPMVLRDVVPSDRDDVLALHQRVFGAPVDAAWFNWKYVQGGGEGVGLWHNGEMIAHCGGVPRKLWHAGALQRDLQIGDVMVAPEWRGILTRRGPFFHVSKRLYDTRLGRGRPFFAGFGFPSARHLQLAVKAGLLWRSGVMTGLQWGAGAPEKALSHWRWRVSALQPESPAFDVIVNGAWERMRAQTKTVWVGERDAAYVRWRYLQRPAHDHVFLQLRRPWQRRPLGLAVLARVTAGQPAHWLDWLGPPELLAKACAMCRTEAAHLGATGMTAWASQAVLARLSDTGIASQAEVAHIGVPTTSAVAPDLVASLDWWFMGGDTDFL